MCTDTKEYLFVPLMYPAHLKVFRSGMFWIIFNLALWDAPRHSVLTNGLYKILLTGFLRVLNLRSPGEDVFAGIRVNHGPKLRDDDLVRLDVSPVGVTFQIFAPVSHLAWNSTTFFSSRRKTKAHCRILKVLFIYFWGILWSFNRVLTVYPSLTVAEGETVDERRAIEPVVVCGVAQREKAGSVSQQRALQPGRDWSCRSKVKHKTR